jgi:uncharacterized membrane protein YccC
MARWAGFDIIDLRLVRVLPSLLSERSVCRAAIRLASTRPAASAQLGWLREQVREVARQLPRLEQPEPALAA